MEKLFGLKRKVKWDNHVFHSELGDVVKFYFRRSFKFILNAYFFRLKRMKKSAAKGKKNNIRFFLNFPQI
jgi:hypothetical protein